MPEVFKKTLLTLLKLLLIALGVFLVFKVGGYLVPFIVAFIFASLIEPLVRFIESKLRITRKIGSVFSILVVLGTIFTVLGFIITRLVKEIINVYNSLNLTTDNVSAFIDDIMTRLNSFYISLPVEVADGINKMLTDLTNNLENLLKPIVDIATSGIKIAFSLPQALIFVLVTILATYFMSSDKHKIIHYLDSQIPENWLKKTKDISHNVFVALFGWLKAQLILMTITFSEVLTGLLIIGIENPLLVALIIAVVDALPVLGAGTVLIPWAIVNLISGNTRLGLSLALLYIIILFVRQLIEPKIVGQQIGIHPLFTLFGMYLGLQFIGVLGMFLGPLTVVLLKYILEGILKVEGFKGWYEKTFRGKGKVILSDGRDEGPGPPPIEH